MKMPLFTLFSPDPEDARLPDREKYISKNFCKGAKQL